MSNESCQYPTKTPGTGYRYGCRCERCKAQRRAYGNPNNRNQPSRPCQSSRRTIQDSCITWDGNIAANGYGRTRGKLAHRWTWEQNHGPIPKGLEVMHLCDNPGCVAIDHLVVGTHRANMLDRNAKGRDCWGPNRPSLLGDN